MVRLRTAASDYETSPPRRASQVYNILIICGAYSAGSAKAEGSNYVAAPHTERPPSTISLIGPWLRITPPALTWPEE